MAVACIHTLGLQPEPWGLQKSLGFKEQKIPTSLFKNWHQSSELHDSVVRCTRLNLNHMYLVVPKCVYECVVIPRFTTTPTGHVWKLVHGLRETILGQQKIIYHPFMNLLLTFSGSNNFFIVHFLCLFFGSLFVVIGLLFVYSFKIFCSSAVSFHFFITAPMFSLLFH